MLDAAEVVKHLLLRLLAHRAGVEQDHVRVFRSVRLDYALAVAEDIGHLVRVVLVHLATKGTDVKLLHYSNVIFVKQRDDALQAQLLVAVDDPRTTNDALIVQQHARMVFAAQRLRQHDEVISAANLRSGRQADGCTVERDRAIVVKFQNGFYCLIRNMLARRGRLLRERQVAQAG